MMENVIHFASRAVASLEFAAQDCGLRTLHSGKAPAQHIRFIVALLGPVAVALHESAFPLGLAADE